MAKRLRDAIYETRKARVEQLSTCNCCEIHQKNRPTEYGPWVEIVSNKVIQSDRPCKCSCRHEARFICRGHPDYNPQFALTPNDREWLAATVAEMTQMAYMDTSVELAGLPDEDFQMQNKIIDTVWG